MNITTLDLLKKINDNGYKAYLVGGYPRDLYMGRSSIDYDVCTSATPKELKEIFNDSILKIEQYGSVTLIYQNLRFEITTFRKDIKYLNNRKPIEIEYINSLEDDLKRRGYTELSLGVGPEAVRNIEIYFHLGFKDYIKTVIEYEPSKDDPNVKEEDVILFYKKKI